MVLYKYKAISKDGEIIEGFFEAFEEDEVLAMLKSYEYLPIVIKEHIGYHKKDILFGPRVKNKDLAVFCRQFHIMIDSGMDILECIDILKSQTKNKTLNAALNKIYEDIQKGYTISQAMEKHQKVFPTMLVNMIEAGELSGSLSIILDRVAIYFEKENKLQNKIKSAMIYPMILIIVSIIVVTFMVVIVFPSFINMFDISNTLLPLNTRILLSISKYLKNNYFKFITINITIINLLLLFKKTVRGQYFFDNLKIKIPGIKTINIKIITARFARTLSVLISSGIPLLDSLEIVSRVLKNIVVEDKLLEASNKIKMGTPLSVGMKKTKIFSNMVHSMLKVGEESGSLDEILIKVADFYDEEVEESIQRMITLIEPILIIIMALIIGFIVMAIALPIFDIIQTI